MSKRTCTATNKRGEPCQARAVTADGLCAMHGGLTDPKAIGRKGGSRSPLTKLRRAADDELRDKAKAALVDALDGDDEKRRFDAAKTLYSFRASAPPPDQAGQQPGGSKVVGLGAVLEAAAEARLLSGLGLDEQIERDFLAKLRARRPATETDDTRHLTRTLLPSSKVSSGRASRGSSPPATNNDFDPLAVPDEAPFDDSQEAKLERRYGSEVEGSTWRWS